MPFPSLARYGSRGATRSNHRWLAVRHLGLRAFVPAHDMRTAMDLAARAAFDTDDGRIILARLSGEIKAQRFVLPSADTLERIGLAGRARARRLSAPALNDALGDERKKALEALLEHDPGIGWSRLTWLRTPPHSTSAPSMLALLAERLTFVRVIALPRHLGDNIHPARRAQFAREGAVARGDRRIGRSGTAGPSVAGDPALRTASPLRAGDVWVEGSQDYRRFDAYLVPMDETQRVLGDSTLETDGPAWLTGRRERLHDRSREVRAKLGCRSPRRRPSREQPPQNHSVRSAHPARGRTPRPRDRWAYAAHPDPRFAVGCERPDGLPRRVYRSALRARPLQSGRAPRRDSRRRNQPRAGAHGARVERREPAPDICVPKPTPMPWRGSSTPTTHCRSQACGAAPAGPRRTGSSLRRVATPRRSTRNTGRIRASRSTPSCQGVTARSIPT